MVLTGAAGALGRRVLALLADACPDDTLVAVDRVAVAVPPGVVSHVVDLLVDDPSPVLGDADVVVHLASVLTPERDDLDPAFDVELARRTVGAALGARHLVVVSSATVYGAWETNPIPITEAAPVRPNPGFGFAVAKAGVEIGRTHV